MRTWRSEQYCSFDDWDWPAAERSLRRALALDPAHTEGLVQYGALMEALGKLDEGLQFKQQALVRNPRSPWLLVQIATSVLASAEAR